MSGIFEDPQPIEMEIAPLDQMPAVVRYLEEANKTSTVLANLNMALNWGQPFWYGGVNGTEKRRNYCEYLKDQQRVSSCEELPQDPPFPTSSSK